MHALGRVGKPHTLDGTVTVTRPKAALLTAGTVVTIGEQEYEITRRGGTDARPLLHLSGVDDVAAAEALRGQDLLVPRDALPALEDDEFWPDDLVGLPVRATTGESVGTIAAVLDLPSCDVLRVDRPDDRPELLVPLHRQAVPELDVATRTVTIDLGFLGEEPPRERPPGAAGAGEAPAGGPPAGD